MLSAARSLRQAAAAEPLPDIPALWRMSRDGVQLRRGELVMVAGIPNSGKSLFVLWLAASLNLPTLYFSADNNAHTSMTRLLAFMLQCPRRDIVDDLDDEEIGTVMEAEYAEVLQSSSIQFCFDGSLDLRDVTAELSAYVELYDEWPEVIIVDNLINIEGTGDHQGQNGILSELHYCARLTGACVFVLHHMSESSPSAHKQADPHKPPARSQVQNKVTQYPDMVLGVAGNSTTGDFWVAVLKNRADRADPTAASPYRLWADYARCTFHDSNPNWSPSGTWAEGSE